MRRAALVFAFVLAGIGVVLAQTDYFRRVVIDPSGGTTPGTSALRLTGLPSRTTETQGLWVDASGNVAVGAVGTVTSVGLSMPSVFSVAGSPVTSSGTLSVTLGSPWTWTTGGTFGVTSGSLTLSAASEIVAQPATALRPAAAGTLRLGTSSFPWLTIHASELRVGTLVAAEEQTTTGGAWIVAPSTTLIADVSSGATTIDVAHNNMRPGEYVVFRARGQFEVMSIGSAPPTPITGGYRYDVIRNQDGSGANAWQTGDALFATGSTESMGWLVAYADREATMQGYRSLVWSSRPHEFWRLADADPCTSVVTGSEGRAGNSLQYAASGVTCNTAGPLGDGTGAPQVATTSAIATATTTAASVADVTTGSFTVEGWIYPPTLTPGFVPHVLYKGADTAATPGYRLGMTTSGVAFCAVGNGTTRATVFGAALTANAWAHLACVVDRQAGTMRIYVNGVDTGVVTSLPTGSYTSTVTVNVLHALGNITGFRASNVAVYHRALAASEIAAHYAARAVSSTSATLGPTIVGMVRTGAASWSQVAPRWAVGRLDGLYGYTATTCAGSECYGTAFGDPAAANLTIDPVNGVRIRSGTTNLMQATGGSLTLTGTLSVAASGGIRLTPQSAYLTSGAVEWARSYGGSTIAGSQDRYAIYGLSSGSTQVLDMQNIANPNPGNALDVSARTHIGVNGWRLSGGGQATGYVGIRLRSEPGPTQDILFDFGSVGFLLTPTTWTGPDFWGFAADSDTGLVRTGSDVIDLYTGNTSRLTVWNTGAQFTVPLTLNPGQLRLTGATLASLGTPQDGTVRFCADCTPNATNGACSGGGTGALAVRQNGAWRCIS